MTDTPTTAQQPRSVLAAQKRLDALQQKLQRIEEDRKQVLQAQQAQATRLAQLAKIAGSSRRDINRKKMLIGAMIWSEMVANPKTEADVLARLKKWLTRDRDQQLFFPEPATTAQTATEQAGGNAHDP